jgi:hypothetical protein
MIYSILADIVIAIHFLFIVFVVIGALLVLKWQRIAFIHLAAACWGALIMFQGWICPLTPLENKLRRAAGQSGYDGGFIEHYLLPIIYPTGLTREIQIWLGVGVVLINLVIYSIVLYRVFRK